MAKQTIPNSPDPPEKIHCIQSPNPVTQLPPTSAIIDADLFNRIIDLVYEKGEEDDDHSGYKLRTDTHVVIVPAQIDGTMPGFCTLGNESRVTRVYLCAGLGSFKDDEWETVLELNLNAFFSGMVPDEFEKEMIGELHVACDHLPVEKRQEIFFKVRDEIELEDIKKGGAA